MGLPVQHDVSGLWGIVQSTGPSGKFCNAQPRHKHCGQGAVRREWQALSKGCNTAHDACGAALREPLCECDSVLRFLPREGPLPAKRALIRTRTVALNVTELSTWPTSHRLRTHDSRVRRHEHGVLRLITASRVIDQRQHHGEDDALFDTNEYDHQHGDHRDPEFGSTLLIDLP